MHSPTCTAGMGAQSGPRIARDEQMQREAAPSSENGKSLASPTLPSARGNSNLRACPPVLWESRPTPCPQQIVRTVVRDGEHCWQSSGVMLVCRNTPTKPWKMGGHRAFGSDHKESKRHKAREQERWG